MEKLILKYYSDNKDKKKWKNGLKNILESDSSFIDFKSIKFHFLKSPSTYQIIWHVLEKDYKKHCCLECGVDLLFNNRFFYPVYCSRSCTAIGSRKSYTEEKIKEIVEKTKKTNIEKYGFENPSMNDSVKKKTRKTCIEKYGKESPMQCKEIQEKQSKRMKETNLERYGVESTLSLKSTREKFISTMNIRYGVESPWKNEKIKEKMENTMIERYGNKSYAKTTDWMERFKKHEWGNRYYNYCFPSGKTIKIQGYEKYAIDYLLKIGYSEDDIKTESKEKPHFRYNYLDKERVYKPDIYLEKDNLIIEVKSLFTYNLENQMNLEKEKTCLNSGFEFQFWIFDRKGNLEIISNF